MQSLISKLINVASSAADGLSYSFAVVAAGPIIVHMSGTTAYSKVAAVVLMASIGSLFNIIGAQGVIYTLAGENISAPRRSEVFSATLVVTAIGMILFSGALLLICRYASIRSIFSSGEITTAAILSWLLCVSTSLDGVFGGALKARNLIRISSVVEVCKMIALLGTLTVAARNSTWAADCACFIGAVTCSVIAKAVLAGRMAQFRLSSWAGAIREIRQVAGINSWQWLLVLSAFFFQQADRLVVASRLGAGEFAVYSFCWQLSLVVQSGTAASLIYILPIATARASNGAADMRQAYGHDVKFGALIATILAMVFVLAATAVFHTSLVPGPLRAGLPVFLIMSGCMYLSSLSVIPYYYVIALGWVAAVALVNLTGALLSFMTALATVGTLGITGLALAKAWGAVTLLCYWFCHLKFRARGEAQRG